MSDGRKPWCCFFYFVLFLSLLPHSCTILHRLCSQPGLKNPQEKFPHDKFFSDWTQMWRIRDLCSEEGKEKNMSIIRGGGFKVEWAANYCRKRVECNLRCNLIGTPGLIANFYQGNHKFKSYYHSFFCIQCTAVHCVCRISSLWIHFPFYLQISSIFLFVSFLLKLSIMPCKIHYSYKEAKIASNIECSSLHVSKIIKSHETLTQGNQCKIALQHEFN